MSEIFLLYFVAGFKKADSRHSSVSSMNSKTKPKNMVFEDEIEDSFNDSNKP